MCPTIHEPRTRRVQHEHERACYCRLPPLITGSKDSDTATADRGTDSSQHINYSDRTTEYRANWTSTPRQTPGPDRTEYITKDTIYRTKPLPPAWCLDTTRDPQQQQQQVTALTIEAVQSRDTNARDEQRRADSCNTPDTQCNRQMAPSQMSTHSSIMDVDPARRQRAPLTLPSGLDIENDTMQLDHDLVRGSIQRVLRSATEAPAPQSTTESVYGALNEVQRKITGRRDVNPDPQAYTATTMARHARGPQTTTNRGDNTRTTFQERKLDGTHGSMAYAIGYGPHPGVGQPTSDGVCRGSVHPHPDAAELDMQRHHYPPKQSCPALSKHCKLQTHHVIRGWGPLGLDTWTGRRRIHRGVHGTTGGGGPGTNRNTASWTNIPTVEAAKTSGPCPHTSRPQHPGVHGRHIREADVAGLAEVRDSNTGRTHRTASDHSPDDVGQPGA